MKINAGLNLIGKKVTEKFSLGITNNEIKYIMKVIKSLENKGILLKGTTRKITSQEGWLLNFLKPLRTIGLPLIKSTLTPVAKRVLIPLGLSAGMSAGDEAIQNKIYEPSTITLTISNEEMEDIMKIVKVLEEPGLLIKVISKIIKNEAKGQKGRFLKMLLETLAASILGNAFVGKGVLNTGKGVLRTGENFQFRLIL